MKISTFIALILTTSFCPIEIGIAEAAPKKKKHIKKHKKKTTIKKIHQSKQYKEVGPLFCSPDNSACQIQGPVVNVIQEKGSPKVDDNPIAPGETEIKQDFEIKSVVKKESEKEQQKFLKSIGIKKVDVKKEENPLGLYFGVGLGFGQLSGQYNLKITSAPFSVVIKESGLSRFGIGADLHVGYIYKMNQWGLGTELYYNPLGITAKETFNFNGTTQEYKAGLKSTMGIIAKGGYYVRPETFLFATFGMERQKINLQFTDSASALTPIKKDQNTTGVVFGFGLRQMFGKNWGAGLESVYSLYGKKTFENAVGIDKTMSEIKPRRYMLRFTLSYSI